MAEAPAWYFSKALSHRQKVCRLYKRAIRQCDAWYLPDVLTANHHKVVMRARFDVHANEKDLRKSRKLLIDGTKELWNKMHPSPLFWTDDHAGVGFEREGVYLDMLYDYTWTPYDKARYPTYFAKRAERKKEFLDTYNKIKKEKEEALRKDLKL